MADEQREAQHAEPEEVGVFTRRGLLGAGGAAAAGGMVVAASPAAAQRGGVEVGSGPTDRRTIGFVGRINQEGRSLSGAGFLTRVERLTEALLFTQPRVTSSFDPRAEDPSTARFTYLSTATVQGLSQVGDVITVLARGSLRFFYQQDGGATFDDFQSFGRGRRIALFQAVFQNDLALETPERANVKLAADFAQQSAERFRIGGRTRRLGRRNLTWVMEANGRGQLLDPGPPRSVIVIGGTMGVADAEG